MKKVQVNTPLILEQNGEMVRIETGQVIDLTDEVYAEVSAHTTLIEDKAQTPMPKPNPQSEPDDEANLIDDGQMAEEAVDELPSDDVATPDATDEVSQPARRTTRKKAE